jgi:cytochrome b561
MDMDSAAVFLAGSILYALGLLIILGGIIIANNLIHKFWKSFGWKMFPTWVHDQNNTRFATEEELKNLPKDTKSK